MEDQQALLDQLHGLQLPEVSPVPAIGWWLLAAMMCALFFVYRHYKKTYRQRFWYRQALVEISAIRDNPAQLSLQDRLSKCSVLARQLAMVAIPRAQAAGTVGDDWLLQLDSLSGQTRFSKGAGQLLAQAPYQAKPTIAEHQITEISDSLEQLANTMLRSRTTS